MTERPAHDESLGDDCSCFACHLGSVQFKGKPQTKVQIRPVEQPPSHWGKPALLERPGGHAVPIFDEGRMVTEREAQTNKRHQVEELRKRQHYLSQPS